MITSSELSVIVQGAINPKETLLCLRSIKKYLPDAEIILSTWEGSEVSYLKGLYDVLLLNKDPGADYYYNNENGVKYNNLNRQLVSSHEGLKRATRIYAMKIRSDIILSSDKFLKHFDTYLKRDKNYSLFKHKILASTVFSRFTYNDYQLKNRFLEVGLLFHVSDWWFLGLTEDLKLYFDIPLIKEPEFSSYYKLLENKNKFNPYIFFDESYVKFSPEQYYAIKCFEKKFSDIKIEHAGDISDKNIEKSRKYLINNFIFLEYSESGIYTNKYLISKYTYLSSTYLDLYNKYRQMLEYRIYCDSEYPISKIIDYILNNKIFKKKFRYLMFYFQQTVHSKSLFECISKILHTIFYFFICIFLFLRMSLSNIFGNKNEI